MGMRTPRGEATVKTASGTGVPCHEAQADGVPCTELRQDCADCDRVEPERPEPAPEEEDQ